MEIGLGQSGNAGDGGRAGGGEALLGEDALGRAQDSRLVQPALGADGALLHLDGSRPWGGKVSQRHAGEQAANGKEKAGQTRLPRSRSSLAYLAILGESRVPHAGAAPLWEVRSRRAPDMGRNLERMVRIIQRKSALQRGEIGGTTSRSNRTPLVFRRGKIVDDPIHDSVVIPAQRVSMACLSLKIRHGCSGSAFGRPKHDE